MKSRKETFVSLRLDYALSGEILLLEHDRLVLRHECLHDGPCEYVSYAAKAEHDEVAALLALESEEGERASELRRLGEEQSGTLLDEERTYAASHTSDTGDGGDCALREHVADGAEEVG